MFIVLFTQFANHILSIRRSKFIRRRVIMEEKELFEASNKMDQEKTEKQMSISKVAKLVKELVGDRSIRRAAEDSGVAASYITGIIKEKYLPSADILRKLASPRANPRNGIYLEDLMVAAGYQTDYLEETIKEVVYESIDTKEDSLQESNSRIYLSEEKLQRRQEARRRHLEYRKLESKYEVVCMGAIYRALAEKNISYSSANDVQIGRGGFKADLVMYVSQQPILEWWFEFKYIEADREQRGIPNLKSILGQFMFIEPKMERKISLVINSKLNFEEIISYKNCLAYRGDLSVILIDEDNLSVIDEVYLAHYEDSISGKYNSEFTLV